MSKTLEVGLFPYDGKRRQGKPTVVEFDLEAPASLVVTINVNGEHMCSLDLMSLAGDFESWSGSVVSILPAQHVVKSINRWTGEYALLSERGD